MKKIRRFLSLLLIVLIAISVVMLVLVVMNGEASVGTMLAWAYVLFGIALAVTILFPIVNLATNPKGAVRTLLGIALFAAVIIVSYMLSSAEPIHTAVTTYDDPVALKVTDTSLYTLYFALVMAILVAIGGEIWNSFK